MAPKIVVIVGPTASGKTRMAVELAQLHNGEVVSADSMQIYRGMDIGTAKPTREEMGGVPHHMLDVAVPGEDFSVARYVDMAAQCVDDILARGKLPIVAGGTGLYIDSLLSGRTFAPFSPDSALRGQLEAELAQKGGQAMLEELAGVDPESARRLHPNDHKRIIRALEVYRSTGRTITQHNLETQAIPPRRPAGGGDGGGRPGGRGAQAAHQRHLPPVHRHAGHRLQGVHPGPGGHHGLEGSPGAGEAALPAVRQAPAHLVSPQSPHPLGAVGRSPGF